MKARRNRERPLDGDQIDLLLLPFYGHTRFRRELEDGCLLAFIQAREERPPLPNRQGRSHREADR